MHQCSYLVVAVLAIWTLCAGTPVPSGTTTARSPTQIGETLKQLTNQLMETNATSPDVITLDTRTPPKIKQHLKKKTKVPEFENSHAGVAIPVDEDEVGLEQTTKKLNFYKIEKPTTNSGLSTWILLSGQTTPKPSRKPIIKPNEGRNVTVMVDTNKIIKPIFKKRVTTSTTTTAPPPTTKLTKVKASALNSAKKVSTTTTTTTTTTEAPTTITTTVDALSTTTASSSTLPIEAKDGETDLSTSSDKKTRRPTTKRKKNKNRRRRPSEKSDNSTKLDKPKPKEKPIGTQLYNYLSREVMPTVGVGLVGLMVTAGLAGYFLYPFGGVRRSYDIDRRDKDVQYHYMDEYSGEIAEEEAIGKVIAGMPSNSLYGNTFKTPTSRHVFSNKRVIEQSTGYTVAGEEATPAAVPEHGPRSLKRRKRDLSNGIDDAENEIDGDGQSTGSTAESTTFQPTTTPSSTTTQLPERVKSFIDVIKDLFQLKVHLGLQLLQNATQAVSKYVSNVQRRLDEQYRNTHTHTH